MTDANGLDRARDLVKRCLLAALTAVDPEAAVRRHLRRDGGALVVDGRRVAVDGRLVVLGVGKAAVGMARGAEAVCGDLITDGLVITKDGHVAGTRLDRLPVFEAAHPVPDERGVRATQEMLALLGGLTPADTALALISGGGSALLEAPRPPVTLADLGATIDLLLRSGAPIEDLNAVRAPLSLVKGGGLRRAADGAHLVTLILSDVLGNDPRVIASGPTVGDAPSPAEALAVLGRYGLVSRVPASVVGELSAQTDGGSASPVAPAGDVLAIVGDNAAAVEAARQAAMAAGLTTATVWTARRGEAADLGREWVAACLAADDRVDVLVGGGEATVTVRGKGVGGRNTEFALAAALALEARGEQDWVIASLATDGQDGPTEAAGAIADGRIVGRARAAGVDPLAALAANDSLRVFAAAGGLVAPGPTGTNVNDIYLGVRLSRLRALDRS